MRKTVAAYTIIGSKVNRDDFFDTIEYDIHSDCDELGSGPYCSTCGNTLGKVRFEKEPIRGFEPEGGHDWQGTIGGLDIKPIRNRGYGDADHFLAAVICESSYFGTDGHPKMMPEFDLDMIRSKVRSVLEPLGIWDPDKFGIWTALYYVI